MGVVQGLTEFLPVSSSGHLIVVPWLLGWHAPFIDSLAFSVMLHLATLLALLVYFRSDWMRLIPAGLAALRDRSFPDDPDPRPARLLPPPPHLPRRSSPARGLAPRARHRARGQRGTRPQ